jgi:hypothetical protein
MILVTEIANRREREAAFTFLAGNQRSAEKCAYAFDAGSAVTQGPVRPHKNGASFEVRGFTHGAKAGFTVTIPKDMPEGCAWNDWTWELEEAGLNVMWDADYEAIIYAAADRDDQLIADNEEAYLACGRSGGAMSFWDTARSVH